jgi:hypothetical protein
MRQVCGLQSAARMNPERRDTQGRADVLRAIVAHIVKAPNVTVTIASLQALLQVPKEAAERLLARLEASGVVVRAGREVWISDPRGDSRSRRSTGVCQPAPARRAVDWAEASAPGHSTPL